MVGHAARGAVAAIIVLGVAAGCDGGDATPTPSATATATASAGACARPEVGRADPAATFRPGPRAGVPRSVATGEPLTVDAVVLDRDCRPAAGARLRIWHTDARGLYGPKGGDDCCFYEARGRTDQSGRFRLETIRPAQYPEANAPPAHIHVEIGYADRDAQATIVFGFGSPPATVTPVSGPVLMILSHDSAGWRGETAIVL